MLWRRIGGVIAGLVVAFLLVQVAELLVHQLYPPPPGTNMKDFSEVKKFVSSLPAAALVLVLAGWLVGTVTGTFIAARIGRSAVPGYVVGAILFAAGVMNSIVIPQPVWFSAVSFVIFFTMTIVGSRLAAPAVRSAG